MWHQGGTEGAGILRQHESGKSAVTEAGAAFTGFICVDSLYPHNKGRLVSLPCPRDGGGNPGTGGVRT